MSSPFFKSLQPTLATFPSERSPLGWVYTVAWLSIAILPFSAAIGALGLLISLVVLWRRHFGDIIRDRLAWGLGLLTLWLIVTTVQAAYPLEALAGMANFLPCFALFLAFIHFFRSFRDLYRLAGILAAGSAAIVAMGIGQVFWEWSSPDWIEALGTQLIPYGRPVGRLSSLFMYANSCSAYLAKYIKQK